MSAVEPPRLYLILPLAADEAMLAALPAALAAADVACVRLRLGDLSEAAARELIARVRPIAHAQDAALVLDGAARLARETGCDGAHLEEGPARLTAAREILGADAILGAGCAATRHAGMVAGESGADYVAFRPVSLAAARDGETVASPDLFAWWREMIELPVVAEGGVTPEIARDLARLVDFVAIGPEAFETPAEAPARVAEIAAAVAEGLAAKPADGRPEPAA